MPRTRKGDDFHKLVECLERALNGSDNVEIDSPRFLPDKVTGKLREHDVVLTYKQPNRTVLVAIECRDRSRKIDVGQIEAFHTKCRDTGIDKGVIVCSKGFFAPALEKAKHYNIDCLLLEEVKKLDWCLLTSVSNYSREIGRAHIEFSISEENLVNLELFKDIRLFQKLATGVIEEITPENFGNFVTNAFSQVPLEYTPLDKESITIRRGYSI